MMMMLVLFEWVRGRSQNELFMFRSWVSPVYLLQLKRFKQYRYTKGFDRQSGYRKKSRRCYLCAEIPVNEEDVLLDSLPQNKIVAKNTFVVYAWGSTPSRSTWHRNGFWKNVPSSRCALNADWKELLGGEKTGSYKPVQKHSTTDYVLYFWNNRITLPLYGK